MIGAELNLLFIAVPDALSADLLPFLQHLHGVEVLLTPVQQFRGLLLAAFRAVGPITTAISRRWPSTAEAIRLNPAPDVWPVFRPSTFMVLSHSRPFRFCWVMPFHVRLFWLYMW